MAFINKKYKNVVIEPGVTSIGTCAFEECRNLTSITISNSVRRIGDNAFYYCDSLTSITIPDSVINIGDDAFYGCYSLTEINVDSNNPNYSSEDGGLFNKDKTELLQYPGGKVGAYEIPDGVINIGDDAFYGCYSLTSITIPDSVTRIENYAFGSCYSLTEINVDSNNPNYSSEDGVLFNKDKTKLIRYPGGKGGAYEVPDGVINIGDSAFSLCDNLTTVTIPDGVTRIENYAFFCCDLTSIIIPESARSIGVGAFQSCSNLEQITIPNGVTIIGGVAFNACESLTSITIPDSVTSIGRSAFSSCTKLMNVTIGNGVTSIGDDAFGWCKSLTEINVDSNNPNYSSEGGVLFNKDKTELLQYPGGKVGAYEIPDGVINIGDSAFYYCESLTSITIPDSVMSIENYAFCWCESLMSVTIGNGVTRIGDEAFYLCESLTSITIPDSVINIGDNAFGWGKSLTEINVDSNNPNYSSKDGVLFNKDKTELLQYPGGKVGAYEIPDGVINIGDSAFYDCESLTSITIPDSVTYIGYYAFLGCENLSKVRYSGEKSDWDKVYVGDGNDLLLKRLFAADFYNSQIAYVASSRHIYDFVADEGCLNMIFIDENGLHESRTIIGVTDFSGNELDLPNLKESYRIKKGDPFGPDTFVEYRLDCEGMIEKLDNRNTKEILTEVTFSNGKANKGLYLVNATTMRKGSLYFFNTDTDIEVASTAALALDMSEGGYDIISILEGEYNGDKLCTISAQEERLVAREGNAIIQVDDFGEISRIFSFVDGYILEAHTYTLSDDETLTISGTGPIERHLSPWYSSKDSIKKVVIEEGTTSIGYDAFYKFSNLTSITIPDGVTTIGGWAFSGCKNLTDVYYGGTEAQWNAIYVGSGNSLLTSANIHFYPGKYHINSITIEDMSGNRLDAIPTEKFVATVSFTNVDASADAVIIFAQYTKSGALKEVVYKETKDVMIGSTTSFSVTVDNSYGDIAKLKAFCWESFDSLVPMGNDAIYPAEQ